MLGWRGWDNPDGVLAWLDDWHERQHTQTPVSDMVRGTWQTEKKDGE